jgi:hypothetical protein
MKQHTPAPWGILKSEQSRPDSRRVDIVSTLGEFAPSFIAGDALPEDARLIAAAPDLLSALNLLLDKLHAHAPGLITDRHTESAITKAESAIAKAKGEA